MNEDITFESKLIKDNTWMIFGRGCTAYLLVGDDFGVMIDTGENYEDIHEYVTTLTDKPVDIVLNTHGHFDHTGGNGHFKVALMGRLAAQIAKLPNGPFGEENIDKFKLDYPIVVVDDGFKIDLGGRVIEAFKIDAHSPDSIAWLDYKERIVFGGDALGRMVPNMYKCDDPQPSMLLLVQSLGRLLSKRADFDYMVSGHGRELCPASYIDYNMICALRAINGECDERPKMGPGGPGGPKGPGAKGPKGTPPAAGVPAELKGFVSYKEVGISFCKNYATDPTRYDIVSGT